MVPSRAISANFSRAAFFHGVADMHATHVAQHESALKVLRRLSIINNGSHYLHAEAYLHFDVNMSNDSIPLVLLQAVLVLATNFCQSFLSSPYFLAPEESGLEECGETPCKR
jgi:hypothetical protein